MKYIAIIAILILPSCASYQYDRPMQLAAYTINDVSVLLNSGYNVYTTVGNITSGH